MSAVPENIESLPKNTIETLVAQLIEAKRGEDAAKKHRIECEERILALFPAKEEGSMTVEAGGFKVTVTGSLTYSCDDIEKLRQLTASWDDSIVPLKTTTTIDGTGLKWIRKNQPNLWRDIAGAVTVKPAKASVKVGV